MTAKLPIFHPRASYPSRCCNCTRPHHLIYQGRYRQECQLVWLLLGLLWGGSQHQFGGPHQLKRRFQEWRLHDRWRTLLVFNEIETMNLFYFDYKIGIFVLRDTKIHFPSGSDIGVTIRDVPQVRNCLFDTAAEIVVMGNTSLSCRPVQLN